MVAPPTSKLIWTRAIVDWDEDQALLQQAHVAPESILRLPCLQLTPYPVPALNQLPQALVVTSVHGLHMARQSPVLQPLWSLAIPFYTHSRKTMRALASFQHHLNLRQPPSVRTAHELADFMVQDLALGTHVLSLGAQEVAFDLVTYLRDRGLEATHLACYQTMAQLTQTNGQVFSKSDCRVLAAALAGILCFASPSAVAGFTSAMCQNDLLGDGGRWRQRLKAVAIGPTTAAACAPYFSSVVMSAKNDLGALLKLALHEQANRDGMSHNCQPTQT